MTTTELNEALADLGKINQLINQYENTQETLKLKHATDLMKQLIPKINEFDNNPECKNPTNYPLYTKVKRDFPEEFKRLKSHAGDRKDGEQANARRNTSTPNLKGLIDDSNPSQRPKSLSPYETLAPTNPQDNRRKTIALGVPPTHGGGPPTKPTPLKGYLKKMGEKKYSEKL